MRKIAILLCTVLVMSGMFSACSAKTNTEQNAKKKIHVVTTIFPAYDWVREILGDQKDQVDLTLLADKGVDLHNYQPTADDLVAISNCDLFIYVGGESDEWVEDALAHADNKDRKVINLMEVLGDSAKTEEVVEGMQEEDHHDTEEADHESESAEKDSHTEEDSHTEDSHQEEKDSHTEDSHQEEHEHEEEYDEHVWLSLKNASLFCKEIASTLSSINPAQKETYTKNADTYVESLSQLDKAYEEAVSNASNKTLLFGDRFPFRYLTEDYHLAYYAAFVGCSAETEASFETIKFLAEKTDELKLPCVLTIEGATHEIAETIVANTAEKNQKILTLDSMQSVTKDDIKNGATYLGIMTDNLAILKEALQ